MYGLDRVAAEFTSLAHSSGEPCSTSAKRNPQFILDRKRPVDSQLVRAQREASWRGRPSKKASGLLLSMAGTLTVAARLVLRKYRESDVYSSEQKNLSYETRRAS